MTEKSHLTGTRSTDPAGFGKVAVLYGGRSAEREISLKSGTAILASLRTAGVDAHGIDVGADVMAQLVRGGYDRAFIALHGSGGEDGAIQGALETLGLAYTGSGVLGSALCMDKEWSKLVWATEKIPTPPFIMVDAADLARTETALVIEKIMAAIELPLIIKPTSEGSSFGISKVTHAKELPAALRCASHYGDRIMVERCIEGTEYTAAILDNGIMPLIRLETHRRFYDAEAKYSDNAGTRYHIPCGLEANREAALKASALAAFSVLDGSGWGRVDFLCDPTGEPWFIEANTVPGMTDHSLVPMAARALGMDFHELVWRILETSFHHKGGPINRGSHTIDGISPRQPITDNR